MSIFETAPGSENLPKPEPSTKGPAITTHLHQQEADVLITAAGLGIRKVLEDLNKSGLFCAGEIEEMLAADSKTISVSGDQLILKWVKMGHSASEIRQITINAGLVAE